MLINEGPRLTLIAQRDHRANSVTVWNCKGLASEVLVKSTHLMRSEAERGGLQSKVRCCRAQVIERNTVRNVIVAEMGLGHP